MVTDIVDRTAFYAEASFPDAQAMAQKFLQLARPVLNGGAEKFADAILSLERFDKVSTATALGR